MRAPWTSASFLLYTGGRFRPVEFALARQLGEAILAAIPKEQADA